MEISEYENIEIFNNTQSFDINKCENQIIRQPASPRMKFMKTLNRSFHSFIIRF
jgi:hypothetical protein